MRPSNNIENRARLSVGLTVTIVGLMSAATLLLSPPRRVSGQASPSWSYTGSTNTARIAYTTTLLRNGKVLVTGGFNLVGRQDVFFNSAEIYDPATGIWSFTGNLNASRYGHTATLLLNGKVLVVGGTTNQAGTTLNSAELYDTATGTWSTTANCNSFHVAHTATLLANGKVLVAGGFSNTLNSEIYDPASGVWSNTGSLNVNRSQYTATLLPNGKVLVVAGINCDSDDDCVTLNSAELYDPASGTWSFTGSLNNPRFGHTATLLPNGKLLIAGGYDDNNNAQNSAELFDPATGMWNLTGNLNTPRVSHTATLLPNGKVLVAAGWGIDMLKTSELYDPTTGTWSLTANCNSFHQSHTATLLQNGKVLIAGGGGDADPAGNTAELYDPGTNLNQIDDLQFFVRQHYRDFLNREPEAQGFNDWISVLNSCNGDSNCLYGPNGKRVIVSQSFFGSQEFNLKGGFVFRFYKASLGRLPTYDEMIAGMTFVTGATADEVNQKRGEFAANWVLRTDFLNGFPRTLTPTQFVDDVSQTAGITLSNRSQIINDLAVNNTDAGRALALRSIVDSQEEQNHEFNSSFVYMQYVGYLRRDPDSSGYNDWLTYLNSHPGDFNTMVWGFVDSAEYRRRFGP